VPEESPSLFKALGVIGLGRNRVVRVPVDNQGRMRPEALPKLSGPAIICTQAGNVNTGAFDPHPAIVEHARQSGAWVHVDGAFGLWAAAAPSVDHLYEGVAEADSWATDAHKWLNVPYDSGLAFVRDSDTLCAAMAVTQSATQEQRNPSDFTDSRAGRWRRVWQRRALGAAGWI
jgi:glutamate/tyrosine decarboxylase-like PLP-dependent enzyme